jgi:uncharacterized cupin superfamily protein
LQLAQLPGSVRWTKVCAGTGWRYHPYVELVYILEGTVTMQIRRNAPVTVRPDETFHAPANTIHRATNANETALTARSLWAGKREGHLSHLASDIRRSTGAVRLRDRPSATANSINQDQMSAYR